MNNLRKTMISIITTSYNYEEFIIETIKSIQAQTYSDWELIIVDDASCDNSVEVIKSFCEDKRIKLICHNKNKGLTQSVKTGLKYAKGDWIAFLESDDLWAENALEERVQAIRNNPQVGIIFNDVEEFGDKKAVLAVKNNIERNRARISKLNFPKNIFYDLNIENFLLTFSAVMIKKETLDVCPLDTPIDALLDWWIFIHVSFNCTAFYINKKLTKWRQHKNSYLFRRKKTKFKSVNLEAYLDVWKTQKLGIKFLPFFLKTVILTVTKRFKFYYVVAIRTLKKLVGIKPKESPLFND